MTIAFMVVGPPRTGTTWASAWLSDGHRLCHHDPLYQVHFKDWDRVLGCRPASGVACTGVFHLPAWLNSHPARKLVLHRPYAEVAKSLAALGLGPPDLGAFDTLDQVLGYHMPWTDLFRPAAAAEAWRFLFGVEMDQARHAALRDIQMGPRFEGVRVNREAVRRLVADVAAARRGA